MWYQLNGPNERSVEFFHTSSKGPEKNQGFLIPGGPKMDEIFGEFPKFPVKNW